MYIKEKGKDKKVVYKYKLLRRPNQVLPSALPKTACCA